MSECQMDLAGVIEWTQDAASKERAGHTNGADAYYFEMVLENITSLTTQLETERERATKAEAALREKAMEYLALDQQATEALARAVKAEEDRARLRTALVEAHQAQKVILELVSKTHNLIAALKTWEPSHD